MNSRSKREKRIKTKEVKMRVNCVRVKKINKQIGTLNKGH